jgi:ACS family hexuronate transporter-like MFS transporter
MWMPCLVMAACSALSFVDRQALALLAPTILEDTGLNVTQFGIIASVFFVAYTVGNPVWGTLLDHIGLRIGMLAGVAFWTAGSLSHVLMASALGFAAARATLGFGEGATFPGGLKTAVESLPSHRRGLGIAVCFSGGTIGGTLAPLVLVPIGVAFGWRAAFIFTGILGAAWILLWLFVGRPPYLPKTKRKDTKIVPPNPFERRFWAIVFSYALPAVSPGPILTIIPLYYTLGLGLEQGELASYLWAHPLAWGVGYFFWGWVADRYATGNPRPVGLFFLLVAFSLTFGFATWTASVVIATILISFSAFIGGGFQMVALKAGSYAFPREQAGVMMGIASGSWALVNAALLPILGFLFNQGNFGLAFWLIALCPLTGILLWLALSYTGPQQKSV